MPGAARAAPGKGENCMPKRSAQTVLREGAYYTIAAANGRVLEVADVEL